MAAADWIRRNSREAATAAALMAIILAASWAHPGFATVGNFRDLAVKVAPAVIVGAAMTLLIVAREIDVSVGAVMGLCSVVLGIAASPARLGWSPAAAAALCLAAGLAAGIFNGALVVLGRAPAILATLGTMLFAQGLARLAMGGEWITDLPGSVRQWGLGSAAGIPVPAWVALGVAGSLAFAMAATPTGPRIAALGGNPPAADLAGVRSGAIRFGLFALAGLCAGLATLVGATQLQVVESDFGRGFELTVIAATVVGGASVRGGRGTIAGTLLGAALLATIGTALIFLKLGDAAVYWERAIQGAILLAAVAFDFAKRRGAGA